MARLLNILSLGLILTAAGAVRLSVAQPAAQRPTLWSVEASNPGGEVVKRTKVCADERIRQAFLHPLPAPNGEDCVLIGAAIQSPGRFSARCKSEGRILDVQAAITGDTHRDFTVKLLIETDVPGHEVLAQTLRYRAVGACPAR